jgi:hypothetical protein
VTLFRLFRLFRTLSQGQRTHPHNGNSYLSPLWKPTSAPVTRCEISELSQEAEKCLQMFHFTGSRLVYS